MEAKVNFTLVGLFVLVLGATLIGGVLWLSSGKQYAKTYAVYRTYMHESVGGLNVNAPVKFHGVDVGFVRGIALDPGDVERVELTLAVQAGTPVKEDTVAILESQGLTGIAYVDLTGSHNASAPLRARPGESYPVIRSGPSLLARLDVSVTALLASVTRASDNFGALLNDDNRRALASSLADLGTVARTLAARSGTIDATLADASRTMSNAARFTADLPRLAERIERSADAFDRMSESLAQAGAAGTRTLEGTRGDVQQFTSEGLPEMRQLIAELRDVTSTLRRVSADLERNPALLVWGRPAGKRGPGE